MSRWQYLSVPLHLSISPFCLVLSCVATHDHQTTMNLHDVKMLDDAVHDGSRWLGCLLCPSLQDDSGEQSSFNLLTREKVRFWKLKTTHDKNISLSRKSMEGIPIPTSVPAVPTEWNHVKKELRLWAFNGGCQIGSYSDKSHDDSMKKVLQCTRCLHIGHALHLR